MKTNRVEDKSTNDGVSLIYSKFPLDGNAKLTIKEWENGEGYEFVFEDGSVNLTHYELNAMIAVWAISRNDKIMEE